MQQLPLNNNTLLFVPVHTSAFGFEIKPHTKGKAIHFTTKFYTLERNNFAVLPAGNWTIIATTESITEEQARELVEYDPRCGLYESYKKVEPPMFVPKGFVHMERTALGSFRSFLTANSINQNCVILKKQ